MLGSPAPDLTIATLNACGNSLLRQLVLTDYRPVITAARRPRLIREVRDALRNKDSGIAAAIPSNIKSGFLLDFFSLLKNEPFDPRHLDQQALIEFILNAPQAQIFFSEPSRRELVRLTLQGVIWLFRAYQLTLDREGLLDFDDQKLRAYDALR